MIAPALRFLLVAPAALALLGTATFRVLQALGVPAGPHAPLPTVFGLLLLVLAAVALVVEPICIAIAIRQLRTGELERTAALQAALAVGVATVLAVLALIASVLRA